MKQSRCNEKIKKLIPYVVILGLVIFTEIFVFNFSTWKTMSCEPITLSVDEYTDESGRLLDNLHCYIEKWENNNVKVRIVLSDSAIEGETIGWYLYDLENRNIVNIEIYDIINT